MLVVLVAGQPAQARGQLLSPGRLARVHQEIEGLRNCTSCHELGRSGVSSERCLSCHVAVDARLQAEKGYHATIEDVSRCASCHQDHLGTEFQLVRLQESDFDHTVVGYALEQTHGDLRCRDCHAAANVSHPSVVSFKGERGALDRTFLGLSPGCAGCHAEDSPHGGQFGPRPCVDCHDPGRWDEPVGFDHARTAFPLEGLHARVECRSCHGSGDTALYAPVAYGACADCHSDPHAGVMDGTCSGCHSVSGWGSLRPGSVEGHFDHGRTAFALRAAHARAGCVACHRSGSPPRDELVRMEYQPGTSTSTYPRPVAQSCFSCHVDRHYDVDSGSRWTRCADCHAESDWEPSAFGSLRHEEAELPLTGAHLTTPCGECHRAPPGAPFPLAVTGRACADCHESPEEHEDRYRDIACASCHSTDAFDVVAFDHAPLLASDPSCSSCHADRDPHAGQFEARDCGTCHGTERFDIDDFDHAETGLALDGAHSDLECSGCHLTEGAGVASFVRYRPLGTECVDCHGGDR